jgi:hypothetical protein
LGSEISLESTVGYEPRLITRSSYGERRPVLGEVVALLHITFEKRGLKLIEAMSRALPRGEIHELMITDEEPTPGGTVNRVSAIAFFEVRSGGVIVVGDGVTVGGRRLGTLGGFDLTHMPNHMNILVKSGSLEAPRLSLGDPVIFEGSSTSD